MQQRFRRMPLFFLAILLVCPLWLSLPGCNGGKDYNIGLEIVTPTDQDPFQSLTRLTFTVVNESNTDRQTVLPYEPSDGFQDLAIALNDMDYYPEFSVSIEGTDAEEKLVSRGSSCLITSSLFEGTSFAVYFARAGSFSLPPAQLLHARTGLKAASPNAYDLLIVGGAERDRDGSWGDTQGKVEYFTPHSYSMDVLTTGESSVYVGSGLVGHSVTPLDASSVLVAGGFSRVAGERAYQESPLVLSSQETEIVAAVTLDTTFVPRTGHAASLVMQSEVVLLSGGWDADGHPLSDVLSVSAANRTLSKAYELSTPRAGHTQTALSDDVGVLLGVLFYGGAGPSDPAAEWRPIGETETLLPEGLPQEARWGHAAVALGGSRVLIVGGVLSAPWSELLEDDTEADAAPIADGDIDGDADGDEETAEDGDTTETEDDPAVSPYAEATASGVLFRAACLRNASCNAFVSFPDLLQTARAGHTLTNVSDRYVLACGGRGADGRVLDDCELIEIGEDVAVEFFDAVPMLHPRTGHEAIYLPDRTVMILGGFNDDDGALSSVEIFTPRYY